MKQNNGEQSVPYVIGITGTIASGKSSAARYLQRRRQIPCIDADIVGHEVIEAMQEELAAEFGQEILDGDHVNRARLGAVVFADAERLQKLNAMTHPVICERIRSWIRQQKAPVVVLEAIELLRSELKTMVQEVWVVDASPAVRIERMMRERGLSREAAKARINSQMAATEYRRQATHVLDGSADLAMLFEQCDRYLEEIERKREDYEHSIRNDEGNFNNTTV